MNNNINQFEKVSFDQFLKDCKRLLNGISENEIKNIYNNIKLPKRSTEHSAGYDFYSPINLTMYDRGSSFVIPTGIRAKMNDNEFLAIYPRSGLGFKHGVMLANTTGIIDADYYDSDNEGHIMIKLVYNKPSDTDINVKVNHSGDGSVLFEVTNSICVDMKNIEIHEGDKFVQGIFIPYGKTCDDTVTSKRNGGFGSTGK